MNGILKKIIDAIFPARCSLCEQYTSPTDEFESLCNTCFESIPIKTGFSCSVCNKRIPTISNICHKKNYLLISACDYNDKRVQKIIHCFKYKNLYPLSAPLSRLLLSSMASVITELPIFLSETYLVPIPLSRKRLYERGFNQSEYIAKEIIKYLPELELHTTILKRIKHTPQQARSHSREERKQSIQHVFFAKQAYKRKNILLIDDVFTTGATIEDAVRALKEVGYNRIIVATIAKT